MGVESAPLTLQIGLRVRGSRDGVLRDGDTVVIGDRIQVFAQTTQDAHLYLAYCTANWKLAVFPDSGSIFAAAGATTVAPGRQATLVLDDHLGSEVLYVIVSRTVLSSADPRLAAAIKASQPGERAAACGPRFRAVVASKDANTTMRPARSGDGALVRRSAAPRRKARGGVLRDVTSADDDERPLVTIERGMYVNQNGVADVTTHADANGIAILSYRFRHVAALRP